MKTQLLIPTIALVFLFFTSCKKDCPPLRLEVKTITLQPGPKDGEDCIVAYRETDGGLNANANHSGNPDLDASAWTYNTEGWGAGANRSYLKFIGLSSLPPKAIIKSAKLSLYGINTGEAIASPQGNSYYPGSPFDSYGSNAAWLKEVTGDWEETTITWNTKPGTTEKHKVSIPASTSQWNYDVMDLDVTAIVKDMISNDKNYGFCFQQQTETYYRCLSFSGSRATDASKRPKLVVEYMEK
jgi:hypothetical protein